MAEVHTRNGVNWRMVRVIYSNPYGPDDRVELLGLHAQPLMDTFNVRLDVGFTAVFLESVDKTKAHVSESLGVACQSVQ